MAKIPKEVAKDLAKNATTVELFGERLTRRKDGTPATNPKVVFSLGGARDKAKATKAGFPIISVYGDANFFEVGDLIEVSIKKLPKSAGK